MTMKVKNGPKPLKRGIPLINLWCSAYDVYLQAREKLSKAESSVQGDRHHSFDDEEEAVEKAEEEFLRLSKILRSKYD